MLSERSAAVRAVSAAVCVSSVPGFDPLGVGVFATCAKVPACGVVSRPDILLSSQTSRCSSETCRPRSGILLDWRHEGFS